MKKLLVLNGPNINMLGIRETEIYGKSFLCDIEKELLGIANSLEFDIRFFQNNAEFILIEYLQSLLNDPVDAIIFNPAGFSGNSIALRDTLLLIEIPFFEVHISNIYQREEFHQKLIFSDISKGILIGLGCDVYKVAMHAAYYYLKGKISGIPS